jgi:homoserine dehydrogenase
MAETKKVAVIGWGTIGAGVVELLYKKGIPGLALAKVCDIDLTTDRGLKVPPEMLTDNWHEITDDPSIDIVVELIGGIEPAKTIQMEALNKGKYVATANKKLLAKEGETIFKSVIDLDRRIGIRASFVGAHSFIHELGLVGAEAKEYKRIYAILNGTCNYILSKMAGEGKSFDEALKGAQKEGFAEADPTDDIEGYDTENKIRILLGLITNSYLYAGSFPVEGIKNIDVQDILYADELGYSVKLVGVIEHTGSAYDVAVHPALVPRMSLLGSLQGAYNGTEFEDEYGVVSGLVNPGAGRYPTADTVIKDLLDISEGRTLPIPSTANKFSLGSPGEVRRRYYLRFSVLDRPGVLAQITEIFWKYNINIAAVIQKETSRKEFVPVVMTTYLAGENDVQAAIDKVNKLDAVKAETRMLRILDTTI